MCFGCGKPLVIKIAASSANNHLVRKVKQSRYNYEEYTELSVSDNAVGTLAPLLGGGSFTPPRQQPITVTKRPSEKPANTQGSLFALSPGSPLDGPIANNEDSSDKEAGEEDFKNQDSSNGNNGQVENQSHIKFFEVHDGTLIATTKDFKGQTWTEQQNNFFVLYSNAYYTAFSKVIPDGKHLRTASELVGVIDKKNFSRHLEKFLNTYTMIASGGLKLNDDGQKEYQRVLALMENEDAKAGMKYWLGTSAPTQSPPRISDGDKTKVSSWVTDEVDLGELDIRMLKAPSDYVLLTLWIITKCLGKAEAVTNGEAFFYLISKYNTVSVEPSQFRAAFVNNKGKLFNLNKSNNTWFLTPEGEERVKSWVNGQAKAFKKKQAE